MDWLDRDLLLHSLGTAIIVSDPTERIVLANQAAEATLGRRSKDLLGYWFTDILRSSALGDLSLLLNSGWATSSDSVVQVIRISRPDGSLVSLECRRSHLNQAKSPGWSVWELREVPEKVEKAGLHPRTYLGAPARTVERLGPRPTIETVLRVACESLTKEFGASCARVWLLDPGSKRPILRGIADGDGLRLDQDGPGLPEERVCPGMLEAVRTWSPYHSNDLSILPGYDSEGSNQRQIVSLAALPLHLGGIRFGAFSAGFRHPTSAEMAAALEAFASVLSATLSNLEMLRRAEAALLEAESQRKQLETVVNLMPVAVAVAEGPEGRLTLLNSASRGLWGPDWPPESIRDLHERAALKNQAGIPHELPQQPLWRALQWGERVRETVRFNHPDGRERVVEIKANPFPGQQLAAIATYDDITDRVDLQNALAERASQLKALLDHLPVGVAYFDSEILCRACNGPACVILGRSRSQMIGAPASEVFVSAPGLLEAVRRCVLEQTPHAQTATPWAEHGQSAEVRHLDWRFEPLPPGPNGEPQGALALIVDASNRKRADDALRAAKEEAELSARNKARFLSAISHDLRTPVNALNLLCRILSGSTTGGADTDLERVRIELGRASANLVELVNDLLDLTRFDSGESAQHQIDFGIEDWLNALLSPLAIEAKYRGLEFRWRVQPGDRRVRADRVKLGRVVSNLVGNALKFTTAGFVEVLVSHKDDRALFISVRDTGPGIPRDQIAQIFDEFAQLRNPERDRTKGTGLGLAICRRLVEAVGGALSVTSELGLGSIFTVHYPVDPPSEPEPASGPTPIRPLKPGRGEPTRTAGPILLVEDDEASRFSLSMLLDQCGFEVIGVQDGLEALAYLGSDKPSLILLDLMMPGIDGTEVLRRIRGELGLVDLPVVILSGDLLAERAHELELLGANATVPKPVDWELLTETVSKFVTPRDEANIVFPADAKPS